MNKKVSIIAPMYNEEELIQEFCKRTLKVLKNLESIYMCELVLVNDGSTDQTYTIMRELQKQNKGIITIVCLTRNFGLEGAVKAGLDKARGDAVIVMDADLQDPPEVIPQMLRLWEQGVDVVVASRKKRECDTFLKRVTAKIYYKILDVFSGKLKLEKDAANFRLLSRDAVEKLLDLPEVNSVFRVTVPYIGMRTQVIQYERDIRYAGKTKFNFKNMIPYALASITGISVEPLRRLSILLPLNLILAVVLFAVAYFVNGTNKVIFIILGLVSTLFLLLNISLCIIAEYIAQILLEVKGRPLSIIYEYSPAEMLEVDN